MRKVKRIPKRDVDELEYLYNVLGNQHRRNIVLFLGRKGEASFTELRRHLGISVGTLYYNLDNLRGLVEQKPNKKYTLTPKGKKVYEVISKEIKRIEEMYREPHSIVKFYNNYIGKYITPVDLFARLYKRTLLISILGIAVFILGLYGVTLTKLDLTLLEYSLEKRLFVQIIPEEYWYVFKFSMSLIVMVILSTLLAKLFGSKIERPELIASLIIALAPLVSYPYLYLLFKNLGILHEWSSVILLIIIMRLLQIFTIGFLTASLSVFAQLSLERAFIIVFIIMYLSLTLSILHGYLIFSKPS